jgi:hypothetical protein
MRLFLIMLIIATTGITGGIVSANISKGTIHWGWSIIAPLIMCFIWMELMRSESQKLLLVTALSDVVYNGTWFLGMMLMGIPTTLTQKLGIILLVIGVYLVG